MCGIAGYVGSAALEKSAVESTLSLMKNRGPDVQKCAEFSQPSSHICFLHSRLSIIDLDRRADQPFAIGPAVIIFNGEIYNYLELRTRLAQKGVKFFTNSDTEVLLQLYLTEGIDCVKYLEGMWAFAVFDRIKGIVFLSRDRFGEKPLYYCQNADGFYFGSEVKFLRSLSGEKFSVNRRHITRYLVNGYKSLYKTNETFYENVHELGSGSNLVIEPDLKIKISKYWQPEFEVRDSMNRQEAVEGTRERLLRSMEIRLRSDVPLAFCLSGGVDSASLVSIAAKKFGYKVAAFSIVDVDERYNESENIMATVKDIGCEHTIIELRKDGTLGRLADLIAYHDSPVSTISYYIHSLLSKAISEGGYRVAVSGTAADELFTGYYDHFNLHLCEMRNTEAYTVLLEDWKKHLEPIVRNPYLQKPDLYFDNPSIRDHIYLNNEEFASYLRVPFEEPFTEKQYTTKLLRNRMLNELMEEAIPVILHEDDLNSMMHSIENRSPYLDTSLFQFAYSIPERHLIQNGYAKSILRDAVQGILNEKVRLDRHKKGFNASIQSMIDLNDPEQREFVLAEGPVFEIVDRKKIAKVMSMETLPNSYSKFLFSFINAKIFMEQNQ